MEIPLSFAEAQQRYPALVAEVLAAQVASRSVNRGVAAADLKWAISTCEVFDGATPGARQGGRSHGPPVPGAVDRIVAERAGRTRAQLRAWIRTSSWYALFPEGEVPAEVVACYRASAEASVAEEARIAALSPAEHDAEVADVLRQLAGQPGFFAVHAPAQRGRRRR